MPNNEEDIIIANAFELIKEGIVNGDWQIICNAYESISGEKLDPPTQKISRLENIRNLMNSTKKQKPKKKIKETTEESILVDGNELNTVKIEGGLKVISTPPDPEEIENNKKMAAKKSRVPRPKFEPIPPKFLSQDENAEVRFNNSPPPRPRD